MGMLILQVAVGIFGVGTLVLAAMAWAGTSMVSSVGRFRKYVKVLADREYCDIKELAQKTGKSVKAVAKDLRKMIFQRMVPAGGTWTRKRPA